MTKGKNRNYGEEIGNGNSGIKPGHVFTKDESSWAQLKEGCGVVAYFRGEQLIAYGQTWNCKHSTWSNNLVGNLSGAKFYYDLSVFVVKREKGRLVCDDEKGMRFIRSLKKLSIIPDWRRRRFHFCFGLESEAAD